jgi:hypothetical protein
LDFPTRDMSIFISPSLVVSLVDATTGWTIFSQKSILWKTSSLLKEIWSESIGSCSRTVLIFFLINFSLSALICLRLNWRNILGCRVECSSFLKPLHNLPWNLPRKHASSCQRNLTCPVKEAERVSSRPYTKEFAQIPHESAHCGQ